MKRERHAKIIELINGLEIETQEELANCLKDAGFDVTQSTVSRDIRELNLTKVTSESGRQKYSVVKSEKDRLNEKYIRILSEGFMTMDMAQNILVIKTVSGMAMAVALALDGIGWNEIVGCIAGDDTVMCAVRTVEKTSEVMDKIRKVLTLYPPSHNVLPHDIP